MPDRPGNAPFRVGHPQSHYHPPLLRTDREWTLEPAQVGCAGRICSGGAGGCAVDVLIAGKLLSIRTETIDRRASIAESSVTA
jgi:hypothetical protein